MSEKCIVVQMIHTHKTINKNCINVYYEHIKNRKILKYDTCTTMNYIIFVYNYYLYLAVLCNLTGYDL